VITAGVAMYSFLLPSGSHFCGNADIAAVVIER
jgi:hypothetical protein